MGDFLFVFLVVGGLGSFFYYKSRDSVSHSSAEEVVAEEVVAEEVVAEEVVAEEIVAEEIVAEEPEHNALTWRVLQRVLGNPGILQVELYKLFPHENRKQLQSTLLQLDKENVLKREKVGNSYRLFPV
ncbi:MAG: hypothetical protein BA874_02220 [Desulfuromonadales bacterium C00003068]|nr:MAG: hypothetical protein BA874_02220 [Desulfuromonadales bacterium C00003068]